MTYYRRCRLCTAKDGCQTKADIGKVISGLGVTSILHKCKDYNPPYQPGEPVFVRTIATYDCDPMEGPSMDTFPGHFIKQSGSKALVYIKPGAPSEEMGEDGPFDAKNNGFCSLSYSRLSARPDGERVEICKICDGPVGRECDGYFNCPNSSPKQGESE